MSQARVLVVFGTRPEAIKIAPVIHALRAEGTGLSVRTCVTAQHRQLLDPVLRFFDIRPDHDLAIMRADQSLFELTEAALVGLEEVLRTDAPDWVVVQGDTTTTVAASLAAFYRRVRILHVEAGLRTGDKYRPYPEEMNRRLTSVLTDLHCAPTVGAQANLLREGVAPERIVVTGNPVVDALLHARDRVRARPPAVPGLDRTALEVPRVVLVTAHRRESFGEPLEQVCRALRRIAETHPEVAVIYPVHLNPNVRRPVDAILRPSSACGRNLHLIEPLPYPAFVWLLDRADLVVTDSGGVQEEAPALGTPVLVMRGVTERPEGVEAGLATVIGTSEEEIVGVVGSALREPPRVAPASPYGDGHAAERIRDALLSAVREGG